MATLEERKKQQHERLLATARRAAIAGSPELKALRSALNTLGKFGFVHPEANAYVDNEAERIAREDLKQMSLFNDPS